MTMKMTRFNQCGVSWLWSINVWCITHSWLTVGLWRVTCLLTSPQDKNTESERDRKRQS